MKEPPPEFLGAHAIALEIPPSTGKGYEHLVARTIAKLQRLTPHIMVLVPLSLRKYARQITWVHRWNKLTDLPFEFHQVCSCRLDSDRPNLHYPVYVGCTFPMYYQNCTKTVSIETGHHCVVDSLGGMVTQLIRFLLSEPVLSDDSSPDADSGSPLPVSPTHWPPPSPESGPQWTPDSAVVSPADKQNPTKTLAYPTAAKERKKKRRKELKEQGIEVKVKKRPKICEDHYDDCGDDLTSLNEVAYVEKSPNEYNTDEELSDQDNNQCLFKFVQLTQCAYPIDVAK